MTRVYIEQSTPNKVKAASAVAALVGNRVYGVRRMPGCLLPCVVFSLQSTPRYSSYALSGAASVSKCRLEFRAFAKSYAEAKLVGYAMRDVLEGQHWVDSDLRVIDCLLFDFYDQYLDEHDEVACVSVYDISFQE